ncbi:MAG: hypothetical protein A3I61_16820 [Acidobacteria bacterium RIFCSPLOWO2_02_FULL_68_18]|nr:MAG: hypothetical protein A3I61_16820 [Acidobacteria bacterium RIFCSPLOWO2_02_FULL_68_18]OFW50119.1 MAG: hypothetical protein A3G77_09200 [Acidobacteria bacterium RIFCSPLOWO2_12_FULL_68_19]
MCAKHACRVLALLVLACVLAVSDARAQAEGVVRGHVLAAADGSAVAQASVALLSVSGDRAESRSDTAGRFSFSGVRPGGYVLSASAEGFAPRETRFTLEPREVRSVVVALEIGPVAVNVAVTAEAPLPSTHSPSSTVLTAERLDQMPIVQRANLPDALVTLAPGMIRGHDDFVHVRGHEVALNPMIDGVSFWENPHALFSGGLSADVIETANVMTGGFSAEYGNRFGGVVDVVTKSGFTRREAGSVTLGGGQAGRRNVSGEFGGAARRVGYYLFGALAHSDRFLSPPDPEAIHDRGRGARLFVRLDGRLGRAEALRAVVMGDGANFEIPKTPLDVALRPLADAGQRTRQQRAIVGWSRAGSDALVSTSAYQGWSRVRLLPAAGPLTARADVGRELLTAGGKGDLTWSTGPHTLKIGMDVVRLRPREVLTYDYAGYRDLTHVLALPHIHVTGQTIAFSGRDAGGQASAYLQDDVRLGARVTANLGLRLDHHDLVASATHASPRANVAVEAGRGSVVHASYNRFFVPPPVEGVLSSAAGLTRSIREIGRPLATIQPTVEDQVELGVVAPLRFLQAGLTGYFRATNNPVHTTVWPDSRIYSYASFDRARAYGLEVKADAPGLARHGLTGYVNYALGRVYFYNPVTGGFVAEAAHLTEASRFLAPMDQTHTLTGGATYRHARTGLWIGASVEYGSGTPVGHGDDEHGQAEGEADHAHASSERRAVRVPAHFTGDMSLGLDLLRAGDRRGRLTMRLDVQNVANRAYVIAHAGEFSPPQYSVPRLISAAATVRF